MSAPDPAESLSEPGRRPDGTSVDVVGIGNALVDVLSHEEHSFIEEHGLERGSMQLVDDDRAAYLYSVMGPAVEVSGGSAANTMAGVASFGGRAAYQGRVFDDQLGTVFAHDLRSTGVVFRSTAATVGPATGRCLVVVTPDAERTMSTCLGASAHFGPDDVDAELIESSRITYLEGYLFDRPDAKAAYRKAAEIAHAAGRRVALTLSDTFCVERHHAEWLDLIGDGVDILFANQAELAALYGPDEERAIERVRSAVEVGCITLGPRGSVIVAGDDTVHVDAEPVDRLVDTTGAGDLYAAGVLHGLCQGLGLERCGRLGSRAASAVIAHTGARPDRPLRDLT